MDIIEPFFCGKNKLLKNKRIYVCACLFCVYIKYKNKGGFYVRRPVRPH